MVPSESITSHRRFLSPGPQAGSAQPCPQCHPETKQAQTQLVLSPNIIFWVCLEADNSPTPAQLKAQWWQRAAAELPRQLWQLFEAHLASAWALQPKFCARAGQESFMVWCFVLEHPWSGGTDDAPRHEPSSGHCSCLDTPDPGAGGRPPHAHHPGTFCFQAALGRNI